MTLQQPADAGLNISDIGFERGQRTEVDPIVWTSPGSAMAMMAATRQPLLSMAESP